MSSDLYDDGDEMTDRPECHGDEDYYDPDDSTCRQCEYRGTCQVLVRKAKEKTRKARAREAIDKARAAKAGAKTPARSSNGVIRTTNRDFELEEAEEDDTFTSVLTHNAALNALQGAADTFSDAISNIPRKSYTNVFTSARNRRKKKRD